MISTAFEELTFPREEEFPSLELSFVAGSMKIASKRMEWNKTQSLAFRVIKTSLDFLFINLVSNIIWVQWKTFTKNSRHTYIISFFHSSLHAAAFRAKFCVASQGWSPSWLCRIYPAHHNPDPLQSPGSLKKWKNLTPTKSSESVTSRSVYYPTWEKFPVFCHCLSAHH